MDFKQIQLNSQKIMDNVSQVIFGKDEEIRLILAAMMAGGHVLLEDVPGTGKTVLAKALAKSFDCEFSRVQFTPDLLPSELTGINFYNLKSGEFNFRQGSLFANIVLADEINRATPRTQSGLLESMEERQITVDGTTYPLPSPYFVIATQNPIETQGTFPLPEAQLDRFLIQLRLGYPDDAESVSILQKHIDGVPLARIGAVCSMLEFEQMQEGTRSVYIHNDVYKYIVEISSKTRKHEDVLLGVSTRGMLALTRMAQAFCAIEGRDFVTPKDIVELIPYVFPHRIVLKGGLKNRPLAALSIVQGIIEEVKVPVEEFKKG
ncbi:MAG: MoxR family ATPase [Defluviitaleaceae bacterium]|nr:MoxR family ATPase [Defluviitaleaceae bacterium]